MTIKHQWSFNDYVRAKTAFQNTIDGTNYGKVRTVLLHNTDFYVRSDGSDSNNGLANTAGGAWATLGHAASQIAYLDCQNSNVTLHVGAGTFAATTFFAPLNPYYFYFRPQGVSTIIYGQRPLQFRGNFGLGIYMYGGMYLQQSASGVTLLDASYGAAVHIQSGFTMNMFATAHVFPLIRARDNSFIRIQTGVTIDLKASGSVASMFYATRNGHMNIGPTVTTSGGSVALTRCFTGAYYQSYIKWNGGGSGTFTGRKFLVGAGSIINTSSAYTLKGNIAGFGSAGGTYS